MPISARKNQSNAAAVVPTRWAVIIPDISRGNARVDSDPFPSFPVLGPDDERIQGACPESAPSDVTYLIHTYLIHEIGHVIPWVVQVGGKVTDMSE